MTLLNWKLDCFTFNNNDKCIGCHKSTHVSCKECKVFICSKECLKKTWNIHKSWCNKSIFDILELLLSHNISENCCIVFDRMKQVSDNIFHNQSQVGLNFIRLYDQFQIELSKNKYVSCTSNVYAFNSKIEHNQYRDMCVSGCVSILAFPVVFSILCNLQDDLRKELFLANTWLNFLTNSLSNEPFSKRMYLIESKNTYQNDNYTFQVVDNPNLLDLFNKTNSNSLVNMWVVYLKQGENNIQGVQTDNIITSTPEQYYNVLAKIANYSHYFIILHIKDKYCILQSYYAHYTLEHWLDFKSPLGSKLNYFNGFDKSILHELVPNPKYRGILEYNNMTELIKSLEILTSPAQDYQKYKDIYRDLTGLDIQSKPMDHCFKLSMYYFNVNKLSECI